MAARGREVPLELDVPDRHLPARPHEGVCRQPGRASDDRRRGELEGDQPRPDPERHHAPAELRRRVHRQPHDLRRGDAARHRRVAARARRDLDGIERRPRTGDARWRGALDRRHAQHREAAGVVEDREHRAVALRQGHGVRGGGRPRARRPRALHLQDHGLWQDVAQDQRHVPPLRVFVRARRVRGPGAARPVVRRNRERPVRDLRRRRPLAAAADQPAARAGRVDHGAAALPRSRGRDLRARPVDSRRRRAAGAARRRGAGAPGVAVRAPARVPFPRGPGGGPRSQQRHPSPEPAIWR